MTTPTPDLTPPLDVATLNRSSMIEHPPFALKTGSRALFLWAGLLFLFVALCLFALAGFSLYTASRAGIVISIPEMSSLSTGPSTSVAMTSNISERDRYNFYGRIMAVFLAPMLLVLSASVCSYVGIRLLRSAGAAEKSVIPEQDYQVLAQAISSGNEKAVTEYIRLSSLTGTTGTFTKIGLTGLPLATIFLTVLLCTAGIFVPKLLDLAQLTLGAFIGSYVQKRQAKDQ